MRIYHGPCRITVTGISALYPQRVVVRPTDGGVEVVIPGDVGACGQVEAARWELLLQHHVDGSWHENVRAIVGKWAPTDADGGERQTIHSKDRDWPTDRIERNLVVLLERRGAVAVRTEIAKVAEAAQVADRIRTVPRALPTQASGPAEVRPAAWRSQGIEPRQTGIAPSARVMRSTGSVPTAPTVPSTSSTSSASFPPPPATPSDGRSASPAGSSTQSASPTQSASSASGAEPARTVTPTDSEGYIW